MVSNASKIFGKLKNDGIQIMPNPPIMRDGISLYTIQSYNTLLFLEFLLKSFYHIE